MNSTVHSSSSAFILVTLLIKLGVIASLASIIARFDKFRRLLLVEVREPKQKLLFAAFLGVPFMLGVLTRLIAGDKGADLSLEVTVLGGLLGGTMVGLVVGMFVSLPALLIKQRDSCGDSDGMNWVPWRFFTPWSQAPPAGSVPTRKRSGNFLPSSTSASIAPSNKGSSSLPWTGRSFSF